MGTNPDGGGDDVGDEEGVDNGATPQTDHDANTPTDDERADEENDTAGSTTTGVTDEIASGDDVDYEVSDDDRTWGILVHAAAFAGLVVPFGNILGPLVVWLVKRDESRFVDENGARAVNFQLTWTLLFFVALLTLVVGLGFLLVPLVALAWLVVVVVATLRASERTVYDYPLTVDIVS